MTTRNTTRHPAYAIVTLALLGISATANPAAAQLTGDELAALRAEGVAAGWTFEMRANPATQIPLEQLAGLIVPDDWQANAPLRSTPPLRDALPAAFDWRDVTGCPPVRNQGTCGSCWAFATVGVLECNILIKDGDTVDLSEQWLVNCNQSGYGCDGGWFVHQYHLATTDSCGDAGAVMEAACPYAAADHACGCPYAHPYTIEDWAYVASNSTIPTVAAMKQAIFDHGPISVAVCIDAAFQAYDTGIFNASAGGTVNHAVVLVGWNDNGGNGYWILRNSWGPNWGEDGYMRIAYGTSSVGYGACYADYAGIYAPEIEVTPANLDYQEVAVGETADLSFTVKNVGTDPLVGSALLAPGPFAIISGADYNLASGESQAVSVRFTPAFPGEYSASAVFSGGGGAVGSVTGNGASDTLPGDQCAYALPISEGTYTANNTNATTHLEDPCGGGGEHDLWWAFTPIASGLATIDTAGSDFDTVLSVRSACNRDALACSDDYDGLPTSQVAVGVLDGHTYYVRVAGVAGNTGNITLNISTAPNPLTLSGRVFTTLGQSITGVTLNGLPGSPVTDASGNFSATVDYGFTGTVTPTKAGYAFQPETLSFADLTEDVTDAYFVGAAATVHVSGRITTAAGAGISGVTLRGLPGTVITNSTGYYSASVSYGFSGNVLPQHAAYVFEPSVRVYSALTTDQTLQDYIGAPLTGAVQVILSPDDALVAGAAWQLDAGAWYGSGDIVDDVPVGVHIIRYAPAAGYDAPSAEAVSVSADDTTTLLRTYDAARFTLAYSASPQDGATLVATPFADADGKYAAGTTVTLSAVLAAGYEYASWTGVDAVLAADGLTCEVTLDADRTATLLLTTTTDDKVSDQQSVGPVLAPVPCGGSAVTTLSLTLVGIAALRRGHGRPPH